MRSVKLALSREDLASVITESEGVLTELQGPLPPTHMLLGYRVNCLPAAKLQFDSNRSTRKMLIKRFNYQKKLD